MGWELWPVEWRGKAQRLKVTTDLLKHPPPSPTSPPFAALKGLLSLRVRPSMMGGGEGQSERLFQDAPGGLPGGHFQIKACECGTMGEAEIGAPSCSVNARVDSEVWGASPCMRTRGLLRPPALSPSLWELETLPEDPGQYPRERGRQELGECQSPRSTSCILLSVRGGDEWVQGLPQSQETSHHIAYGDEWLPGACRAHQSLQKQQRQLDVLFSGGIGAPEVLLAFLGRQG